MHVTVCSDLDRRNGEPARLTSLGPYTINTEDTEDTEIAEKRPTITIVMSDFDLDAFLKSVHSKPDKKTATFDKDAFMKHLKASVRDRMPRDTAPGRSALFVYRGDLDLLRIARGIAVASTREAAVVELISDELKPGDAAVLLDPLLHGQVLVLVHSGTSTIPANLAEYWPRFCENPSGYTAAVTHGLILDHYLRVENPGAVIVVQTSHMDRQRTHLDEWPLPETDAAELASLADRYAVPTTRIGLPPDVIEPLTSNEHAYRVYRELVDTICQAGHARSVAERILRLTIQGHDPDDLKPEFLYHGVDEALFEELCGQLRSLAQHCSGISGDFTEDNPLPDVYAAAIIVCQNWPAAEDRSLVYRGQRNAKWEVVPSYFRSNRDGSPADLEGRKHRLQTFVQLIKNAYPEMNESQCVAAAQHVSAEARTPTWFIDVTWDPLVALYFASSGGQPEEIGVVDQIVMADWKKYVASRPDVPGGVISVDVPAIERIRRQRGLFLNAPRADLYASYTPFQIWFRQQAGVVFTDPSADTSITSEWLLPEEPKLEHIIGRLEQPDIESNTLVTLPGDPTVPLTAEDLLRTVNDREDVAELNDYHRLMLQIVCELYARPGEWIVDDDTSKYSLYRLDEVILLLVGAQRNGRRCDFESALQWSKSRLTDKEFAALLKLCHRMWMERGTSLHNY